MIKPPVTCVILAGGLGTRLRSVVADQPKCLAPIGKRSFLDIQINYLAEAGVGSIVLSLGYLAEMVVAATAKLQTPIPVCHVVEKDLLGTGGAITNVLDNYGLDEVLVANGDTFLDGDLSTMMTDLDRGRGELFRMASVNVPDRSRFGGIESDQLGRVTGFLGKGCGGAGQINAGLYRVCRAALPGPDRKVYSLETDVLPTLAKRGGVTLNPINGNFIDIGVPSDYFRFVELFGGRS